MRVRILQNGSGLLDNRPYPAVGDVVEVPSGLGVSLLNDKRAEALGENAVEARETAETAAPEKRGPGRPRKTA